MTTAVIEKADQYSRQFARIEARAGAAQRWLLPVRKAALAHFSEHGFPTTHDEEWRFTNVAPLVSTEFVSPGRTMGAISFRQLQALHLRSGAEALLVCVNGRFAPHLSDLASLPRGVRVMSLATALADPPAALVQHLARHAAYQQNGFVALNTALFEDGAFVWIPRGAVVQTPIRLLYLSTSGSPRTVAYPRNLVLADDGSQFKLIEEYIGLDGGGYFNNVVTELVAGDGVVAHHCKVVRESGDAQHIATVQCHQGRDSQLSAYTFLVGGALLRHDIRPVLDGEGANCELHGLYVLGGRQHSDISMRVEHRAPHGTSHEYLRGILDGHARGIFSGRIVVYPNAQKTDAKQTNHNLLLSDDAQATSNPQLEIHADDVKCTHGSTTGQVDDDAMFYLRSRGIAEEAARSLLVYAFARESLEHVGIEPLRRQLEELVLARLPHGELLRDAL